MQALIFGGNGFLANHLIKQLSLDNQYEHIYSTNRKVGYTAEVARCKKDKRVDIYCELTNYAHVQSLFKVIQPEIVLHFASEQGRTLEAFERNTAITVNLLKCCPKDCKIVYASSSTVYGDLAQDLYGSVCDKEQKCDETYDQTLPTSLYGVGKLTSENLIRVAKPDSLILRYVAMVGKDATHGVLPDIIRKLKLENDVVELFGNYPGAVKPYMHIDDCVSATLHLVNKNATGIYNVSPADEIDINKIASYARYAMDLDGKKTFKWLGASSTPSGDNPVVALDNTKLLDEGWIPTSQFSMQAIMKATKEILTNTEVRV